MDSHNVNIQEVVNYCASRLRASVIKLGDNRRTARSWWQVCFLLELVSVARAVRPKLILQSLVL
jgi:hypothetical protein